MSVGRPSKNPIQRVCLTPRLVPVMGALLSQPCLCRSVGRRYPHTATRKQIARTVNERLVFTPGEQGGQCCPGGGHLTAAKGGGIRERLQTHWAVQRSAAGITARWRRHRNHNAATLLPVLHHRAAWMTSGCIPLACLASTPAQ